MGELVTNPWLYTAVAAAVGVRMVVRGTSRLIRAAALCVLFAAIIVVAEAR